MRMGTFASRLLGGATLAAAVIFAGTNLASAASSVEVAKLKGPDRQKILEEGAKKEGELVWYTSLIVDQVARPAAEAFEKKYPGIKVQIVRADSSELLQKVLAESRARRPSSDVVVADIADAMKSSGTAEPFDSPHMADYPAQYVDKDHIWVSIRTSWQGIAWNTRLVKDAEAPQTWEALLDPKWKGKLAWGASAETGAPRLISHLRKIWGEDKTTDYLKKMKTQDIRTLPGSIRTVLDQVIAGEYAIGVNMAMHHIAISKSAGAPIMGAEPEPALARSGIICYVKGAPHPYAGMLFTDFMMDKDGGQIVLRDSQYNPAHPAVKPLPELAWIQPNLNGKTEILLAPDEEVEMTQRSNEIYKQLFR